MAGFFKTLQEKSFNEARNAINSVDSYQRGSFGKFQYNTDILSHIGTSLYNALTGFQLISNIGKDAIEGSMLGVEFDLGDSNYLGFETKPMYGEGVEPTRDFRVSVGKRF